MDTTIPVEPSALLRFMRPVALSRLAMEAAVEWDEHDTERQGPARRSDRLGDLLFSASWAIATQGTGPQVAFDHYCVPRDGHSRDYQRMAVMASLLPSGVVLLHLPDEAVEFDCNATLAVAVGNYKVA